MVCRECGAYNAEHLTHCRVCAAKLHDDAASAAASTPPAAKEGSGDRPTRDFAAAPSWPKSAFAGAPENPPLQPASAPISRAASAPLTQSAQAASEPATRRACPHCGKATLADAPYCAYCGELLSGPAKATPAPAKRPAEKPAPADDYDDDYDDDFDDDDDDYKPVKRNKRLANAKDPDDDLDDYYDDDDEDYDEKDFDNMPKKRGKGTTLLFWGLIVVLIVVIGICGKVIADRNFDGDFLKMVSSIGSLFGREKPEPGEEDVNLPADVSIMYTATVVSSTDANGTPCYDVTVYAPTGSTVQVMANVALENGSATVPRDDVVILRVPAAAFLPNAPCESEIFTVTPNLQVTTADGQTIPISVEPISVTVPVLALTLESPAEGSVQAAFSNDPIVITGIADDPSTDDDHTVEVYINGQQIAVDGTGRFTYNYTPTVAPTVAAAPVTDPATPVGTDATTPTDGDGTATGGTAADGIGTTVGTGDDTTESDEEAASDDTPIETPVASGNGETITIEARKNNCVTAKKTIVVEPYVFQNMSLAVTNDPATGLSSDAGTVTLQGTVTPGATLKVTCDSDKVSFGDPTVTATGNFSIAVTISAVGPYNVTLTATQEGYNDTTTTTIVERPPTVKYTAFQKSASNLNTIIAKVVAGETSSGDVYILKGVVTEILGTTPYTVFKVKLNDDTEVVCVNRSTKSKINSDDVKKKKNLFGTLFGYYNDTTTPYIWVWFITNP